MCCVCVCVCVCVCMCVCVCACVCVCVLLTTVAASDFAVASGADAHERGIRGTFQVCGLAAPHSVVAVLAVHARPIFNAGILAETSFTMTLCYVIDLDRIAFWISKAEGKDMNMYQS